MRRRAGSLAAATRRIAGRAIAAGLIAVASITHGSAGAPPLFAQETPVKPGAGPLPAAGSRSQTPAIETPQSNLPPASRTEASQIVLPRAQRRGTDSPPYFESTAPQPPAPPRAALPEAGGTELARDDRDTPPAQISTRGQGGPTVAQLSKAELEATLAQLTPAERRVLLQAITGSDICDNPPAVPAIRALCDARIETRAGEFAAAPDSATSAEDRLLRGDLENVALPTLAQVVERLARGGASSDDFSNQAIASIALGAQPDAPGRLEDGAAAGTTGLTDETQALVNALINQLGGRAP